MSLIVSDALTNLKELEEIMRNENAKFKDDDIENIDRIAEYLQQLEFEVKKIHDEYETETIIGSSLRHQLTFLPAQIQKEIEDSVAAARQSSMDKVMQLKLQLDTMLKSIKALNERDEELNKLISVLQYNNITIQDKDASHIKHESVITSFNERMSEKAECQIKLNETRDTLRETNKSVIEMEDDITALKERMMKEYAVARDEKLKLEEETQETNEKARIQEEKNVDANKELDNITHHLKQSEDKLRMLFRENERLELSNADYEYKIREGEKALIDEKARHDFLLRESLRLTALEAQTQQNYIKNKIETLERTKTVSEETVLKQELLKQLKEREDIMKESLKDTYGRYKSIQESVELVNRTNDNIKAEIGLKLKDMSALDARNKTVYDELAQMEDAHNALMESMQRELEEYKDQLAKDRELKMIKQREREAKLNEIDKFNNETNSEQAAAMRYLANGKYKFDELSARYDTNEKKAAELEQISFKLTNEFNKIHDKYQNMKSKLENEINSLQEAINTLNTNKEKIVAEITSIQPSYDALVENHEKTTKEYEATKGNVILKKGQKAFLEDKIKKSKEKIIEHQNSRQMLSITVKQRREDALVKMKKQNEDVKIIENDILCTGVRVEEIEIENDKFRKAIKKFEDEISEVNKKVADDERNQEVLDTEYHKIQGELENGWKADHEIESNFCDKDLKLIDNLKQVHEKTQIREIKLSNITEKMYRELQDLAQYLDLMSGNTRKIINAPRTTELSMISTSLELSTPTKSFLTQKKHRSESTEGLSTAVQQSTKTM